VSTSHIEMARDRTDLSHLSLLMRHGPQLIAFLARLVGALTPSRTEGASRGAGDRGGADAEGVSEEVERLFVVCLGERSEVDGSDSGIRGGGEGGEERKKGQ
jgi:hypothetical protein